MNDIAIRFDHVGKLYKLGLVGTGTLSHDLNRWWKTTILRQEDPYLKIGETNDRSKKGASEYVWALKDITFDVHQGDVVGIIGKKRCREVHLVETSVACHLPYHRSHPCPWPHCLSLGSRYRFPSGADRP